MRNKNYIEKDLPITRSAEIINTPEKALAYDLYSRYREAYNDIVEQEIDNPKLKQKFWG